MWLGGGRTLVALVASFALCAGCAGESMDPGNAAGTAGSGANAGSDASGGIGGSDASGGTGGSTGGAGGTAGSGTGGSVPTSGAGGSGGIIVNDPFACPECPAADYGLVIHGDGDDYRMEQTVSDSRDCPVEPLRGSLAGCGATSVYVSACEDAGGDGACLELRGRDATYTDRAGTVWTGTQSALMHGTAPVKASAGALTLELTSGGKALTLAVDFVFCNDGAVVRIVCD